jgi:predicted amidophosphoribosyltransferase
MMTRHTENREAREAWRREVTAGRLCPECGTKTRRYVYACHACGLEWNDKYIERQKIINAMEKTK